MVSNTPVGPCSRVIIKMSDLQETILLFLAEREYKSLAALADDMRAAGFEVSDFDIRSNVLTMSFCDRLKYDSKERVYRVTLD